jgi:hypothetical protein
MTVSEKFLAVQTSQDSEYTLSVDLEGRRVHDAPERVRLAPGSNSLEIELPRRGRLAGRVVDAAGAAIHGVRIDAVQWSGSTAPQMLPWWDMPRGSQPTLTDESGRFGLTLTAGRWVVGICPDPREQPGDSACVPACALVEIVANEIRSLELEASHGGEIAGRAMVPAGEAPEQLHVVAKSADSGFSAWSPIATDGTFRLRPLFPGRYDLTVAADLDSRVGTPGPVRCATGDREVTLELAVVRGSVAGRVVGRDQRPTEAFVAASTLDGQSVVARRSDLDGAFEFAGLRTGAWTIRARTRRGDAAMSRVEVPPGAAIHGVDLHLVQGAELALHPPPNRRDARYEVLHDGAVVFEDPLTTGTVRLTVVPGTWTVRFLAGDTDTLRRTLELGAGERHEVAHR